ncbi:polysaccharide biosynthesis/export family protein [Metallibacterium scheffleri]|uniref:polysaccharide biosynthesis/export family protein n=1 Tax=Metallibacterium scheffleri TaxID=993689 RepID=UPI0023F24C71|nr:polysaccharide biosynthesis/export family protein [Metallibacterium scheffleri]
MTFGSAIPRAARSPLPLRAAALLLPALLLLGGCAQTPVRTDAAAPVSAIVSRHTQTLPAAQVDAMLHPEGITYRLGPGDVIAIGVYLHPDLSIPPPGMSSTQGPPGAVVSNDGNLQLPLLGEVHVAGLTVGQLRSTLTTAYAHYIVNPSISIQVQQSRSIRYYLLGQFADPGLKYSDRPLHLLDALALGGSVNFTNADLHGAYVIQGGHKLPLDIGSLLLKGDLSQNVRLRSGDTVVVPAASTMVAYVFGAVGKPGPVPFVNGRLGLLQALSSAGMDLGNLSSAELDDIRVIRSSGASGTFYVVDAARILRGRAAPFQLESGDIVYVPATAIGSWNAVIQLLLPSLQLVGATLNPFVQILYLKNN